MAGEEGAERTEPATEQRIKKYREEGRVATSRELVSAVALAVGVIAGGLAAPGLFAGVLGVARTSFSRATTGTIAAADLGSMLTAVLGATAPGVLAFVGMGATAGLLAGLSMTGFNISFQAIEVKTERLDPTANFKSQFLSSTPWVSLVRSLAIAGLVAWSVYSALAGQLEALHAASSWSAPTQLLFLGQMARRVFERAIPVIIMIGFADFFWQKWKMSQQMMMTRQEVKEENKDSEGDPQIKQRRRQRARQILSARRASQVGRADVVITNPTHFAVALRYRKEENAAPIIVAKGTDLVALQIRAIAMRNDVPIVENHLLARALTAHGKVGGPVPRDLYGPVAKVLAAIYRRKQMK